MSRPKRFDDPKCLVGGCSNFVHAKAMCNAHYLQKWKGQQFSLTVEDESFGMAAGTMERVRREMESGERCRCGLTAPCRRCVPAIDDFAVMRGDAE